MRSSPVESSASSAACEGGKNSASAEAPGVKLVSRSSSVELAARIGPAGAEGRVLHARPDAAAVRHHDHQRARPAPARARAPSASRADFRQIPANGPSARGRSTNRGSGSSSSKTSAVEESSAAASSPRLGLAGMKAKVRSVSARNDRDRARHSRARPAARPAAWPRPTTAPCRSIARRSVRARDDRTGGGRRYLSSWRATLVCECGGLQRRGG